MDDDALKPLPEIRKYDFSHYHPADHRFWQCWRRSACDPIYGRSVVHVIYWLAFTRRWKVPVLSAMAARWVFARTSGDR